MVTVFTSISNKTQQPAFIIFIATDLEKCVTGGYFVRHIFSFKRNMDTG